MIAIINDPFPDDNQDLYPGDYIIDFAKNILKSNKKIDFKNFDNISEELTFLSIEEALRLKAKVVLDNNDSVSIKTLVSLISHAKFIVANDTGPAHIASHLDKKGIVLFGSHTTAKKVSIENFNFKAISVKDLNDLDVETVLTEIKSRLN